MFKMKEDILLELSVYGQTQENVVLNHTTGLRIDCFCFQRGLSRKVGCGTWRRHEQKWRFGGEEGGIETPTQTGGKTNTRPPSSALMQQNGSITRTGYEDHSWLADPRLTSLFWHVTCERLFCGKIFLPNSYSSCSIPVWSIPFY